MSEEIPQTADAAVRSWFVAAGFTCVLIGGELIVLHSATLAGILVLIASAPFYWAAYKWPWLKSKIDVHLVKSINLVATDARWWFCAIFVVLLGLILSPFIEQRRWPFVPVASAPSQSHIAPSSMPTSIRLLFGNSQLSPTQVETKNIKWQSFDYTESIVSNSIYANGVCPFGSTSVNVLLGQCATTFKRLFLLLNFDSPITYKKIQIEAQGGATPKWEKKIMTENYSILWFESYPTGVVLDIKAVD